MWSYATPLSSRDISNAFDYLYPEPHLTLSDAVLRRQTHDIRQLTSATIHEDRYKTAAPLLAATLTRDPLLVSGLIVAQRLPWLLFTLISGALVDRLDRRKALFCANFIRALLTADYQLHLADHLRHDCAAAVCPCCSHIRPSVSLSVCCSTNGVSDGQNDWDRSDNADAFP